MIVDCPTCGARHRSWKKLAECRWPRAAWVLGDGPFATVSHCHHTGRRTRSTTVMLHDTLEVARAAKAMIDGTGCGGRCDRRHSLIELAPRSSGAE